MLLTKCVLHIFQKFHSDGASIKKVDGFQMVKQMAAKIEIMMQHKIDAIKRIMELAENMAQDWPYEKDLGEDLKGGRYVFTFYCILTGGQHGTISLDYYIY